MASSSEKKRKIDEDVPTAEDLLNALYAAAPTLTEKQKKSLRVCMYETLSQARTCEELLKELDNFSPRTYRNLKILGKGSFGAVFLVEDMILGCKFAMKIVPKNKLTETSAAHLKQEIEIQRSLNHPRIVPLHAVYENRDAWFLLQKYIVGGDLFTRVVETKNEIPITDIKRYFSQLTDAVEYIHKKNIAHRDIKLENIMLDQQGDIKLADFGFAKTVDPSKKSTERLGSPHYAAPEIYLSGEGFYEKPTDIWAMGVSLWVLLYRQYPWDDVNPQNLTIKIVNQEPLWEPQTEPQLLDLLKGLLEKDPGKRLTIEQVRAHPWLSTGADSQSIAAQP